MPAGAWRPLTSVVLKHVRFCLNQFSAAYSVHSLPCLRGRAREGACNKIGGACNKIEGACKRIQRIHMHTLTPSPTLPRKRGREQTEFAARADSAPHEQMLWTTRFPHSSAFSSTGTV